MSELAVIARPLRAATTLRRAAAPLPPEPASRPTPGSAPSWAELDASTRALRAVYDIRSTGPSETQLTFDRLALVIAGFEHMRSLFEASQAASGPGEAPKAVQQPLAPRLDIRA